MPRPRYVGARIGIHDPLGRRVGTVSHLSNTEHLFVCGPEKGLALSESLRRDGVAQEVLFLMDRGDGRRVEAIASPGFSAHVLSFDPAVVGLNAHATSSAP